MELPDLEDVLQIDKHSFPTPAKPEIFRYELEENKIAEYHCLLEGDKIVGYDGFWVVGDEIHISTIAVHPNWRGKGLGELLLQNSLFIAQKKIQLRWLLWRLEKVIKRLALYTKSITFKRWAFAKNIIGTPRKMRY